MNIIIAPDSFKGSLTAVSVADAIEQGIRAVAPAAELVRVPLADGGEGTAQALVDATGGRIVQQRALGPLREPVDAFFGILGDDTTGVVEMAMASGLALVPPDRRDPRVTTTYGTGQLIAAAMDAGCKKIIVAVGGSATNDGGAGMAQALGVSLTDDNGAQLGPGGAELARLARIDVSHIDARIATTEFYIATDVSNPLCGPEGASAVYGPQKGATPDMVRELDTALAHYARIVARDVRKDVAERPAAGAAGGLGAGLMAFLEAQPRMGIAVVLEAVDFESYLEAADLVITGEGKIDAQTAYGKTLTGVGRLARRHGVPVVALAGAVEEEADALAEIGIDAAISIVPAPMSEADAMQRAGLLVQDAAERIMRLILTGREVGEGRWKLPTTGRQGEE
ncbi:MAG: glycerate kinase [Armatimonadota bacterium]|nr:MAG: glycerate kinase [Armatimonadota bacterium]